MMTTQQIADRLVSLCRMGEYDTAQQELYARDVVSQEPDFVPMARVQGLDNLRKKGEAWDQMIKEVHGGFVSDPLVAGNFFSVTMGRDYTDHEGRRINEDEVCVYEVKDGKIIREQFFYGQ